MFFAYCLLTFTLAASLGVIVHCFVSVCHEPSASKLSAITAAVLLCLMLMLISHQERIIRMADRIMFIDDRRIKNIGPREEVLPTLLKEEPSCTCMDQQA